MSKTRPRAILSWSSGKDSALAFQRVLAAGAYEVVGLLTTLGEEKARVAVHDVRESLLDAQAAAMGLPLEKVRLPSPCPNAVYEARVGQALRRGKAAGVTHVLFGDLFLADIRAYREARMAELGLAPVFPLWGESTVALAREMIGSGIRAVLTAVDTRRLDASLAGRAFDESLLSELPAGVDPCGENGEFHTFVHEAPFFSSGIAIRIGGRRVEGGFAYVDVEGGPAGGQRPSGRKKA